MPCFRCSKCGCAENTACSNFWTRDKKSKPLCSWCDPEIRKWHGYFIKQSAAGMMEGQDGFLYDKTELAPGGCYANNPAVKNQKFKEIKKGLLTEKIFLK